MASSSRKKPAPSFFSPLSLLAATFYRREDDNWTYEALAEARMAETALRKLLEVGRGADVKRKQLVIEEAIRTLGVLKARLGRQKGLAARVKEAESKERERMEEMEREIAECRVRTGGSLRRADEVRGDIARLRKEMENGKCAEESEETGSEDCGRGNSKLCIQVLASGDWDDSLDDEFVH